MVQPRRLTTEPPVFTSEIHSALRLAGVRLSVPGESYWTPWKRRLGVAADAAPGRAAAPARAAVRVTTAARVERMAYLRGEAGLHRDGGGGSHRRGAAARGPAGKPGDPARLRPPS